MPKSSITNLPEVTDEKTKVMASITKSQQTNIQEIIYKAIANFTGQVDKLETAIGALYLGYHVGWKVLYIIHNKRTIRQFEEILGITFKEHFEETGPGSNRSYAYKTAEALKKYWKVVNGTYPIDKKRELTS